MPRNLDTQSQRPELARARGERHDDHPVEPCRPPAARLLCRVVTEGRRASMGRSGECPPAGACPLYWPRSRGAASGDRPGSVLECYTGGPRRLSPPARRMAAGEKRREVGRLSPMSTDVDIGATWAGVVRVVALHRPVQV